MRNPSKFIATTSLALSLMSAGCEKSKPVDVVLETMSCEEKESYLKPEAEIPTCRSIGREKLLAIVNSNPCSCDDDIKSLTICQEMTCNGVELSKVHENETNCTNTRPLDDLETAYDKCAEIGGEFALKYAVIHDPEAQPNVCPEICTD